MEQDKIDKVLSINQQLKEVNSCLDAVVEGKGRYAFICYDLGRFQYDIPKEFNELITQLLKEKKQSLETELKNL